MPLIQWAGPDEGCPDTWETCLSAQDADELLLWLRAMRRHLDEIRASCGAPNAPATTAAGELSTPQ